MPQGLRAQGLLAPAALVLSACATATPHVPEALRAGVPPQSILVGDLNELPPP